MAMGKGEFWENENIKTRVQHAIRKVNKRSRISDEKMMIEKSWVMMMGPDWTDKEHEE